MKTVVSFDVDMFDYLNNRTINEMDSAFSQVKRSLEKFPDLKTTWFIRIDSQIEALYGRPDYILEKYADQMEWLRLNGHEIGWHYHALKYENEKWKQNTEVATICAELDRYGKIALDSGLKTTRMGFGFHTIETMKQLDKMGFFADSSAIPRPKYKWETTVKDWSTTPLYPYHPSSRDYRVPGEPHLNIWEVPMTTTTIRSSSDTDKDVLRYINLAYKTEIFEQAMQAVRNNEIVVLICHPYEILGNSQAHPLLALNINDFHHNLKILNSYGTEFIKMSQAV